MSSNIAKEVQGQCHKLLPLFLQFISDISFQRRNFYHNCHFHWYMEALAIEVSPWLANSSLVRRLVDRFLLLISNLALAQVNCAMRPKS